VSPVQNRWLRKYTRPSITVILQNRARFQPRGFSLEYLLQHALESHWDLTEEGWKKVEALGLLTDLEKKSGTAYIEDDEDV
jgi:hypothetical protein